MHVRDLCHWYSLNEAQLQVRKESECFSAHSNSPNTPFLWSAGVPQTILKFIIRAWLSQSLTVAANQHNQRSSEISSGSEARIVQPVPARLSLATLNKIERVIDGRAQRTHTLHAQIQSWHTACPELAQGLSIRQHSPSRWQGSRQCSPAQTGDLHISGTDHVPSQSTDTSLLHEPAMGCRSLQGSKSKTEAAMPVTAGTLTDLIKFWILDVSVPQEGLLCS